MDTTAESGTGYPLDPELATKVNGLTEKQLLSEEFYPVRHQLFYYGLDSVATVHLFRKAQELMLKNPPIITPNEFAERYDLAFRRHPGDGFWGSWASIARDGIFVPRCNLDGTHPYSGQGRLLYAWHDHINLVVPFPSPLLNITREEYDFFRNFIHHPREGRQATPWELGDLTEQQTVADGLKFGQMMWKASVAGFRHTSKESDFRAATPVQVVQLGESLVDYYTPIVEGK